MKHTLKGKDTMVKERKEDIFWGESDAEKLIPYYKERNRRMNAYLDSKKNEIYPKPKSTVKDERECKHGLTKCYSCIGKDWDKPPEKECSNHNDFMIKKYYGDGKCPECGEKIPPKPPEKESDDFIEAMTAWDVDDWDKRGLKQAQEGMRKIIRKSHTQYVKELEKGISKLKTLNDKHGKDYTDWIKKSDVLSLLGTKLK